MELRRALLLFAIVLGVAAIVTSVSNPPERDRDGSSGAPGKSPSARPAPAPTPAEEPLTVRFNSEGARRALVGTGRPATVTVSVDRPGEVRLEGLGLSSPADPLTPARFDVLPSEPGRHPVRFAPAGTREETTIGMLQVASGD